MKLKILFRHESAPCKYNIREILNNEILKDVVEILSTDIESFIPADQVKSKNSSLSYSTEGDKEIDLNDEDEIRFRTGGRRTNS